MPDIIHLLPDAIANQIAAGEVVQRPASAVKELLENSIDAGATSIQLIIKDAGRTLIQVVDDGKGLSPTDARMCFERHATSKIKSIQDIFSIFTMGFRGEAMASIAAVAQVELRSKQADDTIGTCLRIEGSKVISQEPVSHPSGTTISIKNLFYNVPARRNFLKSNQAELRHILEEFTRISMAHPHIFFSLHHNGMELYHLKSGNLRQRLVGLFGKAYNDKLVPVEETTEYVSVSGFIGKPDLSKKNRGEQFFFVNNRFIKSSFLNYAVTKAYENLIPDKSFPFYALFIEINPSAIDVNVHPTKQEIKFEDEKSVYMIIHAAVKHGLAQYSVTPTIDFEQQASFNEFRSAHNIKMPGEDMPPIPRFTGGHGFSGPAFTGLNSHTTNSNWKELYTEHVSRETGEIVTFTSKASQPELEIIEHEVSDFEKIPFEPVQLHQRYILTQIKSGMILIDQLFAQERILFERYLRALHQHPASIQQTLFPRTLELSAQDAVLLEELLPDLRLLGFDVQTFGQRSFVIHGMPAEGTWDDELKVLECLLEEYKNNGGQINTQKEFLAASLASSVVRKSMIYMDKKSMKNLIEELFACQEPGSTPKGKPTFITLSLDEIEQRFA
jgi:DNA mismatch repair protein MutL